MVFTLSSGIARAEMLSIATDDMTTVNSLHMSYCDLVFDSVEKNDPNCCKLGGTCFEEQCCSHSHASSTAVVETQLKSYEVPYRDELAVSNIVLYTNADMRAHYRPPII